MLERVNLLKIRVVFEKNQKYNLRSFYSVEVGGKCFYSELGDPRGKYGKKIGTLRR